MEKRTWIVLPSFFFQSDCGLSRFSRRRAEIVLPSFIGRFCRCFVVLSDGANLIEIRWRCVGLYDFTELILRWFMAFTEFYFGKGGLPSSARWHRLKSKIVTELHSMTECCNIFTLHRVFTGFLPSLILLYFALGGSRDVREKEKPPTAWRGKQHLSLLILFFKETRKKNNFCIFFWRGGQTHGADTCHRRFRFVFFWIFHAFCDAVRFVACHFIFVDGRSSIDRGRFDATVEENNLDSQATRV